MTKPAILAQNPPPDPRSRFHPDVLQNLVSTYASDPFGIEVTYPESEGTAHPVIQVPTNVQVPVAVKSDLLDGRRNLLRRGDIMFRTLGTNNTVSSAPAQPGDWRQIMDLCFNNREADLGGFVRRHLLSSELPNVLAELGMLMGRASRPGLQETCVAFADKCEELAADRDRSRQLFQLPETFGWMEVAAVLDPRAVDLIADQVFLGRLMQSRPAYPNGLWLDTRGFTNVDDRPVWQDGGWETLVDLTPIWSMSEFASLEPSGRFYLKRPLAEDASAKLRKAAPGTIVDLNAAITNITEAMATVIAFANVLGVDPKSTRAGFFFRYRNLRGRRLMSLDGAAIQLLAFEYRSGTGEWEAFLEVPVETPPVNLGPFVFQVVRELFAIFNGYPTALNEIEQRVRAFIERRS